MKRSGRSRREWLLGIVEGMSHPDPWYVEFSWDVWLDLWEHALRKVRRYNDRSLLHDMLDIDCPVPVEIASQLLDLKGPTHRPPAIEYDEEDVVILVRGAILDGHKFPASDGSNEGDSAFDVVAREIGCSTSTIAAYYRKCPRELRDQIKRRMEEEHLILKDATDDEWLEYMHEVMKSLKDGHVNDEEYQSLQEYEPARSLEDVKKNSLLYKNLLILAVTGKGPE